MPTAKPKYFNSVFFLLWIYTFVYLEVTRNVQNPDSTFYSFQFVKLLLPSSLWFHFSKVVKFTTMSSESMLLLSLSV